MPGPAALDDVDDNSPIVYPDSDYTDDFSDVDSDGSDTTARSMSTLSSVEVSSFFREVYGRAYPADQNIPSFVPLDISEAIRLELQHHYLKLLIQSNYFGPVATHLAPDPSTVRRKRVLDIFTADGTWVKEMAAEFEHVDFVSLDVVPLVPHSPCANIAFEVYDVYNGFAEPDASFDIVHTRRTVSQIRDYHAFLREVDRVLKPGGLLLFGQLEVEVYEYLPPTASTNKSAPYPDPIPPSPQIILAHSSLPVMSRGMSMLRDSLTAQQCSVHMWRDLPALLLPGSTLWQISNDSAELFESGPIPNATPHPPTEHPPIPGLPHSQFAHRLGYTSIQSETHILPTSPWHPSPRLHAIGDLVQQIGVANWHHFGLLFRQHGLSEVEADRLVAAGHAELASIDICKVMRYHTVHATKL
ncbi:hypothetical protein FRC10_003215 [Ceratobasidium sp. 414]|nr:hypothetical protein FRC10_003215 [Ceratobasidium sp. 414]